MSADHPDSPTQADADASIPVLTEVVHVDPEGVAAAAEPSPADEDDLRAGLERRIVADVLDRLLAAPELLGEPMHDALRAAVDRFAGELALELRGRLEQSLVQLLEPAVREAVREAVEASLPRRSAGG